MSLPAGVVCDRCNHEVCSPFDAALCDFGPVAMMRTMAGSRRSGASRLRFKFDNGSLRAGNPDELFLELDSEKWSTPAVPAGEGRVQWCFSAQRHDMTEKRLAKVHRALVEMAVERACWISARSASSAESSTANATSWFGAATTGTLRFRSREGPIGK